MPKNAIHFYTLADMYNVQLVHGLNVIHRFPRHIHHTISFGIIAQGKRVMLIHNETVTISAGECFIINPGDPHSFSTSSGMSHEYWVISVSPDVLQTISANVTGEQMKQCLYFPYPVIRDHQLYQNILDFAREVQQGEDLLKQESLFCDIIGHCLLHYAQNRWEYQEEVQPHWAVTAVREYLEHHVEQLVRLEDLARVARMSQFYLNRIFQREVGIPPYEYLVKIRLKRAQVLLQEGKAISEAAYSSGFADQSHLTRFFKKHTGMTPGKYQRLHGSSRTR